MSWFEKDGKELAELIYSRILDSKNRHITKEEFWSIVDSNAYYGFRKTLQYADFYLKDLGVILYDGVLKIVDGVDKQ